MHWCDDADVTDYADVTDDFFLQYLVYYCFSILNTPRKKHLLRIRKSLLISWLKPTLNKRKSQMDKGMMYWCDDVDATDDTDVTDTFFDALASILLFLYATINCKIF